METVDELMHEIRAKQADLRAAGEAKAALDRKIAELGQQMLNDEGDLGVLRDRLNRALAAENLDAAEEGDRNAADE